jgi:hypothetical protein
MKVLVLGGYGNFGARIVRALAGDARIDLLVGGRDPQRAETFARNVGARGWGIDASGPDLSGRLAAEGIGLVVHTAGPFQGQDYQVALAAARAGAHYVDLADGRRFVCDFAVALDGEFRAAGRLGVTGASTVPALSSAVVDEARARFHRLDEIDICIAPGQRAPRGKATLAGVLSYCGAPVRVWRGGRWMEQDGWASPQPVSFARLRPRRGALCDIPDLELFPARYAPVRDVVFRAALEVPFTQAGFALIAGARKRGWLQQPERLAGLLLAAGRLADPLGSGDGGMFVRLSGEDALGQPLHIAWHVTAPGGYGPEIPCMAAILLARRLATRTMQATGAMPCMGLLRLDEFAPEFAKWGMHAEWQEGAHGA